MQNSIGPIVKNAEIFNKNTFIPSSYVVLGQNRFLAKETRVVQFSTLLVQTGLKGTLDTSILLHNPTIFIERLLRKECLQ